MADDLFSCCRNTSLEVPNSTVMKNWKWLSLSRCAVVVLSHVSVWGKRITAFRDYVGKKYFIGINVQQSL
jgi:hypothetical protein